MHTPGDDDLILRARKGDLEAFSILILHHQLAVRSFLLVRLSRMDDAEDLAQDTFVTAWQRLEHFDQTQPFGAWLRGIARNLLRNHLRKFRETPIGGSETLQAILDQQLSETQRGPDDSARMAALGECLELLAHPSRSLLQGRYLEGKTLPELCKETGRKHSALTMQLHRVRSALVECITKKLEPTFG